MLLQLVSNPTQYTTHQLMISKVDSLLPLPSCLIADLNNSKRKNPPATNKFHHPIILQKLLPKKLTFLSPLLLYRHPPMLTPIRQTRYLIKFALSVSAI